LVEEEKKPKANGIRIVVEWNVMNKENRLLISFGEYSIIKNHRHPSGEEEERYLKEITYLDHKLKTLLFKRIREKVKIQAIKNEVVDYFKNWFRGKLKPKIESVIKYQSMFNSKSIRKTNYFFTDRNMKSKSFSMIILSSNNVERTNNNFSSQLHSNLKKTD